MSATTSAAPPPAGAAPAANGAAPATLLANGANGAAGAAPGPDRSWLPESYRADPTFADLRDLDGLAKSYKHAAGLVGVDRAQVVRLPKTPDAPEWSDVWGRLGRPDAPDGYELTPPAGVDETTIAKFRETAHQLGISKTQAAKLMEFYGGNLADLQGRQQQMAQTAQADVQASLRREWGQTYDDQLHAARRAVREVGGEPMLELLEQTRLGDHPAIIRMFAKIGSGLGGPGELRGGGGALHGLTPAAAIEEIRQLQADTAFGKTLMNRQDPGYNLAKERWDRLHQQAYPPEAPAR